LSSRRPKAGPHSASSLRVLLTNNTLDYRAGSELYIYDVAVELQKRGHQPIAFSTILGPVAERLRAATIPVVDDLTRISIPPDIIHGQHHFETLLAVLSFPQTPAINFCHGWTPMEEQPLIFPRIMRYIAVDHTCRDRLQLEHGITAERISVILNFVDTERFRPRAPLPSVPKRALAFGNYFGADVMLPILQAACEKAGLQLEVAGIGSNQEWPEPEARLGQYDIVFAKARAALEAMAVGAAVVLCGPRGLGSLVTPAEWESLRLLNFGVRAHNQPVTIENVLAQLRRYNPSASAAVSARVRAEATLPQAVDQLLCIYRDAVREFSVSPDSASGEIAAARYLWERAAILKGRMANVETRAAQAEMRAVAETRAAQAEMRACAAEMRASQAGKRVGEAEEHAASLAQQLAVMRDSMTWRFAHVASRSLPVRLAHPLLRKVAGWIRNRSRNQSQSITPQDHVGK